MERFALLYSYSDGRRNRQQWIGMVTETNNGQKDVPSLSKIMTLRALSLKRDGRGRMHPPVRPGLSKGFNDAEENNSRLHRLRPEEFIARLQGKVDDFKRIQRLRPK